MKKVFRSICVCGMTFLAVSLGNGQEVSEEVRVVAPAEQEVSRPFFLDMVVPLKFYAVPGHEFNIYFEGLICSPSNQFPVVLLQAGQGSHREIRYTWTPKREDVAKEYPFKIELRNALDEVLEVVSVPVHLAKPDAGAGQKIRLLCIGDSLTNASQYTAELLHLFGEKKEGGEEEKEKTETPGTGSTETTAATITGTEEKNPELILLGTNVPRSSIPENRHEGYGGWKFSDFNTRYELERVNPEKYNLRNSPFIFEVGGKVDFTRYFETYTENQKPDFVTIFLGHNDVANVTDQNREEAIEKIMVQAREFVSALRAALPEARIAVITPALPARQDAFGENYGTRINHWTYRKNCHLLSQKLIQEFSESPLKVSIIPAHLVVDAANGYPEQERPANARSSKKVFQQTNALHPNTEGYKQIADAIYAWMKVELSK